MIHRKFTELYSNHHNPILESFPPFLRNILFMREKQRERECASGGRGRGRGRESGREADTSLMWGLIS